jgi:hypothetical protein
MRSWSENLAACSLEEVLQSQIDNREWGKRLRLHSLDLVNSRLAKAISLDEYKASRNRAKHDAQECRRRALLLVDELSHRGLAAAALGLQTKQS